MWLCRRLLRGEELGQLAVDFFQNLLSAGGDQSLAVGGQTVLAHEALLQQALMLGHNGVSGEHFGGDRLGVKDEAQQLGGLGFLVELGVLFLLVEGIGGG